MVKPKDSDDVQFAARLIMEGLASQDLVQQILKTQEDLIAKGKPLTVAQICVAKKWLTRSEARYYLAKDRAPRDLVPGYECGEELGVGGMSRVFRATTSAGTACAVKVLKPSLARQEKAQQRFRLEAELLVDLDHENIVKGHDIIDHDGLVAYAMELVPGTELLELIDAGHTFHEDAAVYVVLQTARALTHMLGRGLVHRDIKPGNILVTRDNTVKLCDLGLAARTGQDDSDEGMTVGTVAYIAPEQARGDTTDIRADIYSLGVTLYQLIVGEIPFEGGNDEETLAKRFVESLKSPKLAKASPHMHYFIQKMMAPDPAHRYQTPEDLIADMEEQIEGKKTLTVNPTTGTSDTELGKLFDEEKPKGPVRRAPKPGRGRRRTVTDDPKRLSEALRDR